MGRASEDIQMEHIEQKPEVSIFEDVTEEDLEKVYKEDKEDDKKEAKKKWKDIKDDVISESVRYGKS